MVEITRKPKCIRLNADALSSSNSQHWDWAIPLPPRKPFREAKPRIGQDAKEKPVDQSLISLLVEALQARELVLSHPELSIIQIGKRVGRCRKQLTRLLRLSWLSPNIIEAITDGRAPPRLTRKQLLNADLPLSWSNQEEALGFAS